MTRRVFWTILLVICGIALLLRLSALDARPMHTDEAVHAAKLGILLDTGEYFYNPAEFHGPALYYFTLPVQWVSGAESFSEITSAFSLRVVPALFGASIVLLLALFRGSLRDSEILVAALLLAVSPATVFYSRYYIQEILLVFFTVLLMGCGLRYLKTRRNGWLIAAAIAAGIMLSLKELAWLLLLVIVVSAVLLMAHRRQWDRSKLQFGAAAVAIAVTVHLILITNFFRNPFASVDSLVSPFLYAGRTILNIDTSPVSSTHEQPWYFYIRALRFEWPIYAFGIVGLFAAFQKPIRSFRVFIALFAIVMMLVLFAIPYKTPWNALHFHVPFTILSAMGIAKLTRFRRNKLAATIAITVIVGTVIYLALFSYRFAVQPAHHASVENPYAYGHTSERIKPMLRRLNDVIDSAVEHPHLVVIAPGGDYWPLPWYLRQRELVGYWSQPPDLMGQPIVIAIGDSIKSVDLYLADTHIVEFHEFRPGVLAAVYFEETLWTRYLESMQEK